MDSQPISLVQATGSEASSCSKAAWRARLFDRFYALLPRWLPRLRSHCARGLRNRTYRVLRDLWDRAPRPVQTTLHGFEAWMNPGNTYPFIIHEHPFFNAPLVELVHQVWKAKGRQLVFVDVGAALGDTIMLLKQRCSDAVERFITIEGDPEFFVLLCRNMGQFGDVTPVNALLASERRLIPSLVKHHRGTAAALGNEMVEAMPLDDLEDLKGRAVDVLKVDVDGFDGQVLEGAKALLAAHQPAVIFEWHPKLIEATGNAPSQPFVALRNAGYARYLWFGNTGIFTHFSGVPTDLELAKHARYLLGANARSDEHFDVIALPDSLALDEVELALMQMAREWRYRR